MAFSTPVSAMFPLLPSLPGNGRFSGIVERGLELERNAAALGSILPEGTNRAIADHLRIANAYYSNRIEGHDTRPGAIERAMRNELSEDASLRTLQREAKAHVEVEKLSETWFEDHSRNPISADGLRWIHKEFYERVPAELRYVEDPVTHKREKVEPGLFRPFDVTVGRHVPPEPSRIEAFIESAAKAYAIEGLHGLEKVIAFAASHHRILWIHPFGDGNGRVVRLMSSAFARRAGVGGMGLWSPSRGLARRRDDYMSHLAAADSPRRNDTDGRGELSERGLAEFIEFFLEVCLDQVVYMRSVLALDTLGDRLEAYVTLRDVGLIPSPEDRRMRKESGPMLRAIAVRGELSRSSALAASGVGERSARYALSDLIDEGLVVSDTPKGAVRIAMPTHAVPYLLPGLYPEGVANEPVTSAIKAPSRS